VDAAVDGREDQGEEMLRSLVGVEDAVDGSEAGGNEQDLKASRLCWANVGQTFEGTSCTASWQDSSGNPPVFFTGVACLLPECGWKEGATERWVRGAG